MKREDLRKILRGKCISDESCEVAIDELLNLHSVSGCYWEKTKKIELKLDNMASNEVGKGLDDLKGLK